MKQRSATFWIIAITAVISLVVFMLPQDYIKYFALEPAFILQGQYIWTLLTHMFVHAGFLHLFINMLALFSLGRLSEQIIGRKRFLWFYIISGLFAGLCAVVLSGFFGYGIGERIFGSPDVYMVGASGAIFAVAGLFVVLLPRLRFTLIFLPIFSLPAYVMVPLVLVATWLATFFADLPIGNAAHFGGFLIGLLYGFYLRHKYQKKVAMIQRVFR